MKLKYNLFIGIIVASAVILTSPYLNLDKNIVGIQPAVAQRIASSDAWRKVYQQLPEFPLENKYAIDILLSLKA